MSKTLVTLFSGVGGSTLGAMQAGYTPVLSVEHSEKIAPTYAANFSDKHLMVADVRAVDYKPFAGVDLLTASPVCTRASVANPKAGESELDLTCGQTVARAIGEMMPRFFVMENVAGYKNFAAYREITNALDALGYWWEAKVLNAADFGVPQTRQRLIVRAAMDYLPPLPSARLWQGWLDAVADELPNCEKSELAKWQRERLPAEINDWFCAPKASAPSFCVTSSLNQVKAVLVCSGNASRDLTMRQGDEPSPAILASENRAPKRAVLIGDRSAGAGVGVQNRAACEPAFTLCAKGGKGQGAPVLRALLIENLNTSREATIREGWEPSPTVTASTAGRRDANMPRALLDDAVCLALNTRCMGNLQGFPDSFRFSAKKSDACTEIGNAVPPPMMRGIVESLA